MLRAPWQTGKTSAMLALRDLLNGGAEGGYRCLREESRSVGAQTERKPCAILGEMARRAGREPTRQSLPFKTHLK